MNNTTAGQPNTMHNTFHNEIDTLTKFDLQKLLVWQARVTCSFIVCTTTR